MKIANDCVVDVTYTIREGEEVIEVVDEPPMQYLHGHQNIFNAMEDQLAGKSVGDVVSFTLPAEQSYGTHDANKLQRLPSKLVVEPKRYKSGDVVMIEYGDRVQQVTVVKKGRFSNDYDLNHPFAGKTLDFEFTVLAVRAADSEELAHGHVH